MLDFFLLYKLNNNNSTIRASCACLIKHVELFYFAFHVLSAFSYMLSAKPKTLPPAPPTAPPPAPPSGSVTLTLKPPVQREIFVNNKVVLEAVVSGDIKDTVSCTVNNAEGPKVKFSIDSSQSTKKYNVTVDPKKWFNGEKVTCTIRDTNNKEIKQEISFKKGGKSV